MSDYLDSKNLTASTSTFSTDKYPEWEVNELLDFVRNAKTEEDAVANIGVILKQYKKRISAWELIKLLFNK